METRETSPGMSKEIYAAIQCSTIIPLTGSGGSLPAQHFTHSGGVLAVNMAANEEDCLALRFKSLVVNFEQKAIIRG